MSNEAAKGSALAVAAALAAGIIVDEVPDDRALSPYQGRCAQALSYFITQIPSIPGHKYTVTFGEAFRPESVALAYAKRGIGISNSLHTKRLAVDLNLFDAGVFVDTSAGHRLLAEKWMETGLAFGIQPAAGYYFQKQDGNHYSCAWQGTK